MEGLSETCPRDGVARGRDSLVTDRSIGQRVGTVEQPTAEPKRFRLPTTQRSQQNDLLRRPRRHECAAAEGAQLKARSCVSAYCKRLATGRSGDRTQRMHMTIGAWIRRVVRFNDEPLRGRQVSSLFGSTPSPASAFRHRTFSRPGAPRSYDQCAMANERRLCQSCPRPAHAGA